MSLLPIPSRYEKLRDGIVLELGKSCHQGKCGHRAFTHKHGEWASDYAEWLVRVAVLQDCFGGGESYWLPSEMIIHHPPENLEALRADARTATPRSA